MSIVFDFASIGARMNRKPEPVKVIVDRGAAHTHTLTITQLPSHSHTITDPGHTHTLTTGEVSIGWPYTAAADYDPA